MAMLTQGMITHSHPSLSVLHALIVQAMPMNRMRR
jgi:hypothetical protein